MGVTDDDTGVGLAGADFTQRNSTTNPVYVQGATGSAGGKLPSGGAVTSRGGTIAVGGTAQPLVAANANRLALLIQPLTEDMWINELGGTAAADTVGSWRIPVFDVAKISTGNAVSIVSATTGAKFTAEEY